MPAKGGKRGRKGRAGSHAAASNNAAVGLPKPPAHKPVDYSKFDNLTDSDEDGSMDAAFTPSQLGFPEWGQTQTESCDCEHCRARAEAAERASAAISHPSSSKAAVLQAPESPPVFDFGKAFGASSKSKIAEGKATRTHGLNESSHRFQKPTSNHSRHHATNGNSSLASGHSNAGKQSSQVVLPGSHGETDIALSSSHASKPSLSLHEEFARLYLAKLGVPFAVTCSVLDRLKELQHSACGEEPDAALVRVFSEHHIPLDSHELAMFLNKPPEKVKGKGKQGSPKLPLRNSRSNHTAKPDPEGFMAALAKHGFTGSITPLTPAGNDALQTSSWGRSEGENDDDVDSDESPPQSDDDVDTDDELQPSVHLAPSATSEQSTFSFRPPAVAPKLPVFKPALPKAAAAAKPPVAKAVAKAAQVQVVDTVSDDDSEEMLDDSEDDMPGLVTSDESEQEQEHERPAKRTLSASKTATDSKPVSPVTKAKGKQVPSNASAVGVSAPPTSAAVGKSKPTATGTAGKSVPAVSAAAGKQSPPVADAQSIFKPVSRGYLAEQSAKWAAAKAQSTASDPPKGAGTSKQKEAASGTGFSFDRAVSGSSRGPLPGTVRQVQPSAAAEQLLGRHAGSFVHYDYNPSGFAPEQSLHNEVPPLESRPPRQQDAEQAAFGQAAWREADEQGRRAAMSSVGPGTYTSHPGTQGETPQQRLAKQLAADAAMKELLEDEEREKAEALTSAETAKKEKQKNKKAKQKAKKKAQQEAAAKRAGGKKGQAKAAASSAAPAKTAPSDFTDSESEEEEDMQRLSQQNSRFASLVPDMPATAPKVSLQGASGGLAGLAGVSNPEGFGTSKAVALVEHLAAGLDSDNGEEEEEEAKEGHEDSLMRQYGGAFALLQNMGRGPSSEKSHSSQDTQSSSHTAAVPVIKPGQSPLRWSQANPQAQRPDGLAASLGIQPGMQPGYPGPSAGVRSPQPAFRLLPAGVRPPEQAGVQQPAPPSAGQAPDPQLAQVWEECRQALQEMEDASVAGERGRLQEAIRGGVAWLSHNGSNPDVAAKSTEVRVKLRDAKARLKQVISRPASAASQPSGPTSTASSSASEHVHVHVPVSMPAGVQPSQMPPAFRAGQPPPPPPRRFPVSGHLAQDSGDREPGQTLSHAGPSAHAAEPHQAGRPYPPPFQMPASNVMPASAREPYRQPYGQQGSSHEPYRQPYLQQGSTLEPYRGYNAAHPGRGSAGGRGTNYTARPGVTSTPYQQQGPGRGARAGHQGAQQAEAFDAQRQWQGVHPRPPMQPLVAMPALFPAANSSQSGSVYDSDYGSVDRNSVSGSEVASPVKSMQIRNEVHQKYVQPTPFGASHHAFHHEDEEAECVVCMDNDKSRVFVPCGHVLCCYACAQKVYEKSQLCPLCNTALAGHNAIISEGGGH